MTEFILHQVIRRLVGGQYARLATASLPSSAALDVLRHGLAVRMLAWGVAGHNPSGVLARLTRDPGHNTRGEAVNQHTVADHRDRQHVRSPYRDDNQLIQENR